MAMTLQELKARLGAIEANEGMYDGIGAAEIPLLEQLLHDQEAWLAARAVFALARIHDAKALAVLGKAAGDPREPVRVAVAAALGIVQPADANHLLRRLLSDPALGVRKFAIQSVSTAHDGAVHALLRRLETSDPVPAIRALANRKVGELNVGGP